MTMPVGLLIDGVVVHGSLSPSNPLKRELLSSLEVMANNVAASRPLAHAAAKTIERLYERIAERVREGRERLAAHGENFSLDDVRDDELRAVLAALAPVQDVELGDVRMLVGGQWRDVAAIRVRVDRIAAWWPLEAEADTIVEYSPEPTA
jgi:vacuolar-type H+-ATPase subunit I/STV1